MSNNVKNKIREVATCIKDKIIKGEYEVIGEDWLWTIVMPDLELQFKIYAQTSLYSKTIRVSGSGLNDCIYLTKEEEEKAITIFNKKAEEYKQENFVKIREEKIAKLQKEIELGSMF